MLHRITAYLVCGAVAWLVAPATADAQDTQGAHIQLELNALEPQDNGCKISFLVQNGHAEDIAQVVYEAVLFDTEGRVNRLTLFDFGTLPAARPRVRQFVISDLACSSLGRMLINGAQTCEAGTLGAQACVEGLKLDSRTDVELLG